MTDEHTIDLAPEFGVNLRLALPKPLPDAVEAGVFGAAANGEHCPSDDDARSIVVEHLRELVDLTLRIEAYESAKQSGCHPDTGRGPRTEKQRDANRERAVKLWKDAALRQLGHLGVYEDAFGNDARRALQAAADAIVASLQAAAPAPIIQRELF